MSIFWTEDADWGLVFETGETLTERLARLSGGGVAGGPTRPSGGGVGVLQIYEDGSIDYTDGTHLDIKTGYYWRNGKRVSGPGGAEITGGGPTATPTGGGGGPATTDNRYSNVWNGSNWESPEGNIWDGKNWISPEGNVLIAGTWTDPDTGGRFVGGQWVLPRTTTPNAATQPRTTATQPRTSSGGGGGGAATPREAPVLPTPGAIAMLEDFRSSLAGHLKSAGIRGNVGQWAMDNMDLFLNDYLAKAGLTAQYEGNPNIRRESGGGFSLGSGTVGLSPGGTQITNTPNPQTGLTPSAYLQQEWTPDSVRLRYEGFRASRQARLRVEGPVSTRSVA